MKPEVALSFTELVAKHGVYALAIIFIFIILVRAEGNYRHAKPEDKDVFRRGLLATRIMSFFLVLASTAIWIYASFFHQYQPYMTGSIVGLHRQENDPRRPEDPPKIIQRFYPERDDHDFYYRLKGDNYQTELQIYWVRLSASPSGSTIFHIERDWREIIKTPNTSTIALHPEPFKAKQFQVRETYRLNWNRIYIENWQKVGLCDPVELTYKQDITAPEKPGKLFYHDATYENREVEAIALRDTVETDGTVAIWRVPALISTAYAQPALNRIQQVLENNSDYKPEHWDMLFGELRKSDAQAQMAVRKLLVKNGKRSLRLILDVLQKTDLKFRESFEWGILLNTLAAAAKEIEAGGVVISPELNLRFAMGFYEMSDYQNAAKIFSKIQNMDALSDDEYFSKGYALLQANDLSEAEQTLKDFLERPIDTHSKAVAHSALGILERRRKNYDKSADYYKKAIDLDPNWPAPYNNLAYLYAHQGMKLDKGLMLVQKALDVDKTNPSYHDTKGWLLHRLGKKADAIASLCAGLRLAPHNGGILDHIKEVTAVDDPSAFCKKE